jgi:flagellar biosynthesis protein FlhB
LSDEDTGADKSFAPTERRLADARRKGDIAQAADLVQAAALGGFLIALAMTGPFLAARSVDVLATLLQKSVSVTLGTGAGHGLTENALLTLGAVLLPLVLLPCLFAMAMMVTTGSFLVAAERIKPRLSRLSPLAVATHKFGPDGLVDFLRGFMKFAVLSAIFVAGYIAVQPQILASSRLQPLAAVDQGFRLILFLVAVTAAVALVVGAVELLWQRWRLTQRNRMTRKEMTDEARESEGDPHQKAARMARAREIAARNTVAETRAATVLLVNPVHIAVALRWRRGDRTAPVVLAKGEGEIAARMRNAAMAAGVPVWSDVPTARLLYRSVPVGKSVPRSVFQAVATAIRFAEAMRARRRARP